jgi:hypothetical protein
VWTYFDVGLPVMPAERERVSREQPGIVLSETNDERRNGNGSEVFRGVVTPGRPTDAAPVDPDAEAEAFIRYCYRRRSVAWPELYDEMCAVAARGEYRGLGYEQLEHLGIRFALAALPRLAKLADQVIAQERSARSTAVA